MVLNMVLENIMAAKQVNNKLSALQVKSAKCPKGKSIAYLADGGGLRLRLRTGQEPYWEQRFFVNKKEVNAGLGFAADVSLVKARKLRDDYKAQAKLGINPLLEKLKIKTTIIQSSEHTFSNMYSKTIQFHTTKATPWSAGHTKRAKSIYNNYLKKRLGRLPLVDINDELLLDVLSNIYKDHPSTTQKARHLIGSIYKYAKDAKKFTGISPIEGLSGNSLIAPVKEVNHEGIRVDEVGEFLYKNSQWANQYTKSFLYIITVTGLRVGSLINAEWSWYDKKRSVLNIPMEFMKNRMPFICPIPSQAATELETLAKLANDKRIFSLENNTPTKAIQKIMNSKATTHGLRTTFNLCNDKLGCNMLHIGSQMSHSYAMPKIKSVYSGGAIYLEERTDLVQRYADWCDEQLREYKDNAKES